MPDGITVTRWERADPPQEHELYRLMEQAGYSPTLRGEPAGTRRQVHRHPYPEMCWVVSGWVSYTFPAVEEDGHAKEVLLRGGDRLEIPPDTAHTTHVEGAGYAVYLTSSPWMLPLAPIPANINL